MGQGHWVTNDRFADPDHETAPPVGAVFVGPISRQMYRLCGSGLKCRLQKTPPPRLCGAYFQSDQHGETLPWSGSRNTPYLWSAWPALKNSRAPMSAVAS